MPTYTYRCEMCGQFDWVHPMGEEFLYCPKCGMADFKRVYGNIAVSFKGPGFYSTDSKEK